ncbi:MAG: hypothetical protein WBN31_07975 [Gammaproteobacteria bacterium]
MTKPIDNSFWVLPDVLMAGEHPGSDNEDETRRRLRRFLFAGVTQFIDLSDKGERPAYESILQQEAELFDETVIYSHHPIRDKGIPRSPVQMTAVIREISDVMAERKITYVHAARGVGRTGLAAGCYLVECGLDGERALRKLMILYSDMECSAWEPRIPETDQQVEYVRQWRPGGI